uniref:Uncharacterized protein n=1 Tax=Anguilla anguilla TaxID=7936 RepID=A0A0E9U452_ANGAN
MGLSDMYLTMSLICNTLSGQCMPEHNTCSLILRDNTS